MKDKKKSKFKLPIVSIDKSLEKYKEQTLFPEKVEEANKTIKRIGIPKIKKHK